MDGRGSPPGRECPGGTAAVRSTPAVVVDAYGYACPRCGADSAAAVQWLELDDLRADQRRRLPELDRTVVDELGLLVASCARCRLLWWFGPFLGP